ncbi:SDR family NAD(P)-dependent oxidoreductase [Dongia deserti]|uniref:SDR family NAD(P)-dependent oxidoreductase n=1 Tax=Dongia deserti TaxID=2268030 RepID=UPI000E65A223|nr:SDR family oxidoreductase [Dongia deserti]
MAAASLFDLKDRAFIVTGAGRGIGAELAAGLAGAGASVAVAGRTAVDCETVAGDIAASGGRAIAVPFDARDEAQCAALIGRTNQAFGRLDGAVVNHGIGLHRDALETTRAEFAEMLDGNLTSYFVMCRELGRYWVTAGSPGSIVLMSSNASFLAYDELAAYGVSKAGVDQLCRQLAAEWAKHGIRVNAIGPGYMTASMKGIEGIYDAPEVKTKILPKIPAGRYGALRELLGATVYFLSDEAAYTTGQYLAIDGGYSLV